MPHSVKQQDTTDCGAACLCSVASFYKLKIPIAKIRQLAGTDQTGTSVLGLNEAAIAMGFESRGVRANQDSLYKIPLPAIAHVVLENKLQHFVVITKVSKYKIRIMDPGDGKLHDKSFNDFLNEWSGILLILQPGEKFVEKNENITYWIRFWHIIKPHKSIFIQSVFGAIIYTILGLSTSIFIQKITDHVLVNGNLNLLNVLCVAMILILLLQMCIGMFKSLFTIKTGQQIDARLILNYYQHLLKLPQKFFDGMKVGEMISRINDAVKIRTFINDVAVSTIVNLFIVVFSYVLMFNYYWKLAVLMLGVLPIYGLIFLIFNHLNKKVQRKVMENAANLESHLVESLTAIGTIKKLGLNGQAVLVTEHKLVHLMRTIYKSAVNSIYIGVSTEFIAHLFTILLLWLGAVCVLKKQITPGELFSMYALTGYFIGPAMTLVTANKPIQDAVIAADRLFEIMDLEIEEHKNNLEVTSKLIGEIWFQNVDFKFGNRRPVFERLNLKIRIGSFTAIVGESGSGKSTLVALLQNLYPLQSGRILVGQYDIRYLNRVSLQKIFSIVPQQIDLFSGTIIDNIAIGTEAPELRKIIEICTQIGILEFIEHLPDGLYTDLGEKGITLSGGQRQRIAIARALYRDPDILILDEATSSLDSDSEQYIQQTIDRLLQEHKTVIVIAHRLTTIKRADKIIVLDQGLAVEEGSHEYLLGLGGHYNNLWTKQFNG